MLSTLIFFFLLFVQMVDLFMAVRPLPNMFGWHYDKPGRTLLFFGILKGMWSHWGYVSPDLYSSLIYVYLANHPVWQVDFVDNTLRWYLCFFQSWSINVSLSEIFVEWGDWWCWFQAETTWYTLDATFKLWMSILPINWKQFSLETRKKYVSSFKVL
jgi:hypothetical protein